MTREEAKRRLLDIERCTPIHTREDARDFEALEMAIKALSQEPTFDDECQKDMDEAWEQIQKKRKRISVTLDLTPCDDAISREDIIHYLECHKEIHPDVMTFVKHLPSVSTTKNIVNHGTMNIML